jgi:putative YphP/YqiW family bacilliredoxin
LDSMYDREAVAPLWKELVAVGVDSLTTVEKVDAMLSQNTGTTLVMVNSVCGCAAGSARPGVALALQNGVIPDRLATVFAGVDREATDRAREYMKGIPPSSPCVALFKDGQLIYMLQRTDIEGNLPQTIAEHLKSAFDKTCTRTGPSVDTEVFQKTFGLDSDPACGSTFNIKQ